MFEGKEILVIDDSRVALMYLTSLLEDRGANVTGLGEANNIFKVLAGKDFDCVITDFEMPEIKGPDLVKMIRSKLLIKIYRF